MTPQQESAAQATFDDANDTRGLDLRMRALTLLKQAQAIDGLVPFLVVHHHREGVTTRLAWARSTPEVDAVVSHMGINFEPHREESIEFDDEYDLEQLTGVASDGRVPEEGAAVEYENDDDGDRACEVHRA